MSSRAKQYNVRLDSITRLLDHRALAVGATDRWGNDRYTVTWVRADGLRDRANTIGAVGAMLATVRPGDTVNIIRDGRGSIIHIEKANPETR